MNNWLTEMKAYLPYSSSTWTVAAGVVWIIAIVASVQAIPLPTRRPLMIGLFIAFPIVAIAIAVSCLRRALRNLPEGRLRRAAKIEAGVVIGMSLYLAYAVYQGIGSMRASVPATATLQCPESFNGKPFERISIYNGTPGGKEFDLAPRRDTKQDKRVNQIWLLKDYRDLPLFLRCRYQNTTDVLNLEIPPRIETCSFSFEITDKGAIAGHSAMACQ